MIALISAALVAAQPAPSPSHHEMAPMDRQQHEAMKEKCCCDDMAKAEHDKHAASDASADQGQ